MEERTRRSGRLAPNLALAIAPAITLALALGLGACAQGPAEDQNLAHYCQVKSCLCVPAVRNPFSKNAPVALLWRDNGDAYCPKDYKLDPTEKPKGFKSRYGG